MDALQAFRVKLHGYIHQESGRAADTSDPLRQGWSRTRQRMLHRVEDLLDTLQPGEGLEALAQKIEQQLHDEEDELFYMIDDIRVRRSHAFINGDEMYLCVIRRDLLRYVKSWIDELKQTSL